MITDLLKYEDVAGIENIATQIDDRTPSEVIKRFAEIKTLLKQHNISTSNLAFKKASIKKLFSEIDTIISKRFGMNFKHVSVTGEFLYGVYVSSTNVNNAINPNKEEMYKEVEDYLNMCDKTGECKFGKTPDEIENADEDWASILDNLLKATKTIGNIINTDSIVIDFQNARVKNFPKDVKVFIVVDVVSMMIDYDIQPEELTAFLFHEIGHQFTHLSESYRGIANVTALIETLHNEYSESKDIRKSIILTTEKHSNKKIDENNFTAVVTELSGVAVKYLNNDDVYSYTDSEQLADQFSTRFGLGRYLASGLDRIHMTYKDLHGGSFTMLFYTLLVTFSQMFFIVLLFVPGTLITVTLTTILLSVYIIIASMLYTGSDASKNTYDDDTYRFKRVKFDLIRQMRETNLPKDYKKTVLNDIESVEKILTRYRNSKFLVERIGDVMPWNINSFTLTRLHKELEELSENELVIAKNKLEQYL